MGVTFEQLKTKQGDWLGIDTTNLPPSVRGDALNIVMREMLRLFDLRFGETSDTFNTIASPLTRNYALPTGWSRPHTLWYIHPENSSIVFLDSLTKEKFDLNFPDSTKTSLPVAYTVWGANIQLGKTPDRVLTINRNYYKILDDLADGAPNNENEFTKNAWEVLLFKSFAELERYGIEDERIAMWVQRGEEMLRELVIEHARAQGSGRRAQSEEPG